MIRIINYYVVVIWKVCSGISNITKVIESTFVAVTQWAVIKKITFLIATRANLSMAMSECCSV